MFFKLILLHLQRNFYFMMKFNVFVVLFLLFNLCMFSQGSSDTNVSLYGSISPKFNNDADHFSLESHVRFDSGKNDVFSITPYICLDSNINDNLNFQLWVSSKYASGDLTKGFSFGDASFIGTYLLGDNYRSEMLQFLDFGLIISLKSGRGLKIEKDDNYYTYPMEYQASLGTLDAFLSYTFRYNNFNLSIGYQQPLTAKNQNNFFPGHEVFNEFNLGSVNPDYIPSNEMKRSGDVFSRLGYTIKLADDDLSLNIGSTLFYRLKNDEYFVLTSNTSYTNQGYNEVEGTNGLAINGVLQCNYILSKNAEISLYAGAPLVDRKEYIDGTMRSFFITPGFKWNF